MDLKTFIAESLTQIVQGIADAQEKCYSIGGRINPVGLTYKKADGDTLLFDNTSGQFADFVEFDIAVTAGGKTTAGGGGGISVFGADLGAKAEHVAERSEISRIRFRTLVILPSVEPLPESIPRKSARALSGRQRD